ISPSEFLAVAFIPSTISQVVKKMNVQRLGEGLTQNIVKRIEVLNKRGRQIANQVLGFMHLAFDVICFIHESTSSTSLSEPTLPSVERWPGPDGPRAILGGLHR